MTERGTLPEHEFESYGIGRSMSPTLKSGDRISVIPYSDKKIRIGDVILFSPPEQNREVIHRVVSVDARGIRTRGDNHTGDDPWILSPEDINGRVAHARRMKRTLAIYGGMVGSVWAQALRTTKRLNLTISKALHPLYRRLSDSGVFRKLLPLQRQTRILCFNRPNGVEMQLLMGNRVIGKRPAGKTEWHIRRPFRLFIDEAKLSRRDN